MYSAKSLLSGYQCYVSNTWGSNGEGSILSIVALIFPLLFFNPCVTVYGLPSYADNSKYNVVSEQGDSVVMSEYPSVEGGGGGGGGGGRGARTGETETRT